VNMKNKSVAAMAALILGVALGVVSVPSADAAAMNPCGYSVNYYCGVTTSSEVRTNDLSVTATGNYARDTSATPAQKIVGYASGPLGAFYTTASGSSNTVYQTFSKQTTRIYCAFLPPANVTVGCNYTTA